MLANAARGSRGEAAPEQGELEGALERRRHRGTRIQQGTQQGGDASDLGTELHLRQHDEAVRTRPSP
ncbi:MAG: hypothetical protein M3P97_06310, partial [Actinomycetota bacterium]|nr:hypothetical protein [Actinomycetota bacterium]